MATYDAIKIPGIVSSQLAVGTLSGTVKKSSVGVKRQVLIYKNENSNLFDATYSDASGNFSFTVNGGANDRFRVIAVGDVGENSEVFENVNPIVS